MDQFGDTATLITEFGDYLSCSISIDYSKVDPSKTGAYYPISVDLPPGITLAENKALCTAVHVIQRDKVVLDAISTHEDGYYIQWLAPTVEPSLWFSINHGSWSQDDSHDYGRFNLYGDEQETSSLLLYYHILMKDSFYQFKVRHGDDVFSNILSLDFTKGKTPNIATGNEGDRTGVDRDEVPSLPEPHEEPATDVDRDKVPSFPAPHKEPTKSKAIHNYAFAEGDITLPTEPSILLSKKQLQPMALANPHILTFQYKNIFMYVPTKEINTLMTTEHSQIAIFLEELEENIFYFYR